MSKKKPIYYPNEKARLRCEPHIPPCDPPCPCNCEQPRSPIVHNRVVIDMDETHDPRLRILVNGVDIAGAIDSWSLRTVTDDEKGSREGRLTVTFPVALP